MTEIIEKKLYNNDILIHFYPKSHQYKLVKDDRKQKILSVTGIIGILDKPRLPYWAINQMKDYLLETNMYNNKITDEDIIVGSRKWTEKREKAGDIGTLAHEWAEIYIKLGTMSLPEDINVANAVNGFLEWIKGKDIKFIDSERFVYSKKHNYVGTLDSIAIIDGKKYMIDFKTSNYIDVFGYGMQTVAYLKAYEEETGDKLDGIIIARFSKETHDKNGQELKAFEIQEIVDIDNLYNAFLSCLTLKNIQDLYSKF